LLGALIVFRIGAHIPVPGIDPVQLETLFNQNSGGILGMFNMFSGGALSRFTIFALGIMPYISASIIMQLLTVVSPQLEAIKKEGESGRRRITQYTRYGTLVLATFQALGIAVALEAQAGLVIDPGLAFRFTTVVTLVTGTMFLMWLGEQITERGLGNGISIIIFAGIAAGLPNAIGGLFELVRTGSMHALTAILICILVGLVTYAVVFIERGQRRIPIQYAKRVVGRRVQGGQASHLPLKVNVAGVIPPIFASSVMMFPATVSSVYSHPIFDSLSAAFMPGTWVYNLTFVTLIVFFSYFYTAVTFNPVDVADNLRKHGGYVPGVRPGKQTADYLDRILTRLTAGGAIYLAGVSILPTVLITNYGLPFYFGGTSLLIIVGVSLDTVAQLEGHLLTRHYDGLMGGQASRGKGRRKPIGSV